MTTIENLAGITAQHNEIVKRIVKGSLDAEEVREGMQDIIEKRKPPGVMTATSQPSTRFAKYTKHFNSLDKQKALLIKFNNNHAGDLAIPSEKLENLSTSTDHGSHIEDAEIFVVWCGTVEKTVRFVLAFTEWRQGNICERSNLEKDISNLCLHEQAFAYPEDEVDVYRVRVNLVDNWDPKKSRSVDDVYDLAAAKPDDYILASFENIFGWALQDVKLIRLQDKKLPFEKACVGLVIVYGGDVVARVVGFGWDNLNNWVDFDSYDTDFMEEGVSGPSLNGVPQKVS